MITTVLMSKEVFENLRTFSLEFEGHSWENAALIAHMEVAAHTRTTEDANVFLETTSQILNEIKF